VTLPWHCQPGGTIKIGVHDVIGELFAIDCWELVEWVVFDDINLVICMPLAMSSVRTCLWHWLVSALAAVPWWWSFLWIFAFINSWYGPMEGAVKWLIVSGVTVQWEIMLCSWVFRFAEPQCLDGLDDLEGLLICPFYYKISVLYFWFTMTPCSSCCQIPHAMISSFVVAPRGFYSQAY
jgi:hypothetical protein